MMSIGENRRMSTNVNAVDSDNLAKLEDDVNGALPRCVCSWKNCRTFQKAFREAKHDFYDGCIKIKIVQNHPESMAYKASLDRNLGVTKQPEWKDSKDGSTYCKYTIAKHHFTEQHIRKYEENHKNYSFVKPFSLHGAKKYLFNVSSKETFPSGNDDPNDFLYLQTPNVSSDVVKAEYYRVVEIVKHERLKGGGSPTKNTSIPNKQSGGQQQKTSKTTRHYDDDTKSVGTNASHIEMLKTKDTENKLLKDQLDAMKSQLTFLHDMVEKLQAQHFDTASVYSRNSRRSSQVKSKSSQQRKSSTNNRDQTSSVVSSVRASNNPQGHNGKAQVTKVNNNRHSIRSASVPDEINFDDDDTESRTLVSQWNENDYGSDDDKTQLTNGTFHSRFKPLPPHEDEDYSEEEEEEESDEEEEDEYAECMSLGASTILSASRSVKTLPRELELEEDEEDSDTHESLEEEAFELRSVSSSYHQSPCNSHESIETFGKMSTPLGKGTATNTGGMIPNNKKQNHSRNVSQTSITSGSIKSRERGGQLPQTDNGPRRVGTTSSTMNSSLGSDDGPSSNQMQSSSYQVMSVEVTDPYGEKGTYTGSISRATGMPHGHGRLEYDEAGRWYEGDWKHGRWTGYGVLSNGDGDFYEGGLKNDHKHGNGVMQFADGRTYEGKYFNGQMVKGKMTYQDGSTYDGTWVEGMRHGFGRCVFADESTYEGEFKEGEFHGRGKMTWNDGGWYEGEWLNGEMHGTGCEVRADGSIRHSGEWQKGQPIRNNVR